MAILFGDFETRSTVNLKICGADVYARHPSTEIMAFSYGFDDEPIEVLSIGELPPSRVRDHIKSGGKFVAHNISFEWLIWNNKWAILKNIPKLEIEQCECTMARSYALAIPASLEKAAHAMGIDYKKDMKGKRIALQLSQPNPKGDFYDEFDYLEKYQKMYEYCKQDTEVARELYRRLKPLPEMERKIFILDHKINQRGIRVSKNMAKLSQNLVFEEFKQANKKIKELTCEKVDTVQSSKALADWFRSCGLECSGVGRGDILSLLEKIPQDSTAYDVALLRQAHSKSSTAKFESLVERANNDERIRSTLQYHGASTGRWTGRGVQVHNLPRPKLNESELEDVFEILENKDLTAEDKRDAINLFYGNALSVLSDCIRGCLLPSRGNHFMSADYSNIEGRVLAWLAQEEWKLEAFSLFDQGLGEDLYKISASHIFNVDVSKITDWQRQIGKVAELALGFQGGVKAFSNMAKVYGVKVDAKKSDSIKTKWRESNPNIVGYWYELERISKAAVSNPGEIYFTKANIGRVKYRKSGSFLFCQLPSRRCLSYPYPEIKTVKTPWGEEKEALVYKAITNNQWIEQISYGGLLAENITQAVARDILAEALLNSDQKGFDIVMHVHDEILCEESEEKASLKLKEMLNIMNKPPKWAMGLPIMSEGWTGKRYKK